MEVLKLQYEILKFVFGDASRPETLAVLRKYCKKYHVFFRAKKTNEDLTELIKTLPKQGMNQILPKIIHKIQNTKS